MFLISPIWKLLTSWYPLPLSYFGRNAFIIYTLLWRFVPSWRIWKETALSVITLSVWPRVLCITWHSDRSGAMAGREKQEESREPRSANYTLTRPRTSCVIWGPRAKGNCGPLVQKGWRMSRWWQQGIKPSLGFLVQGPGQLQVHISTQLAMSGSKFTGPCPWKFR